MDKLMASMLLFFCCAVFVPAEKNTSAVFVYHHPSAAKVQLLGDWNHWGGLVAGAGYIDPSQGIMDFAGGYWTAELPPDLARGQYRYAFLVNGHEFHADPNNPETAQFNEHRVSLLVID
jgi:hypothetical protein